MALLNMGSEDAVLRLAAYSLLYHIAVALNSDLSNELSPGADLVIPKNSIAFIINFSRRVRTRTE